MTRVEPPLAKVPLRYVAPMVLELEKLGHRRQSIVNDTGIDLPLGNLESKKASLPVLDFNRLYIHLLGKLRVVAGADETGANFSMDDLELIFTVGFGCPTLHSALHRIAAFCRVAGGSAEVVEGTGGVCFIFGSYQHRKDRSVLILTFASMLFFHQIFSWLICQRIPLRAAHVIAEKPLDPVILDELLDVDVEYNQSCNMLMFSTEYLARPIARTNHDLQHIVDYIPFDIWYSGHASAPISNRLRMMIRATLESAVPAMSVSVAAQVLNMSMATMRRRLAEEGTTFVEIKNQCQREFSEYALRCTDESIEEIALRVGYRDDRAFRRAFRQWTGSSPSDYRSMARGG